MKLQFKREFFNPAEKGTRNAAAETITVPLKGGPSYTYDDRIVLAVNLALATRRPLFIAGSPGTGKTTLARNVAHVLGRRYYQYVVTSRTKAKDLQWSFDSLRRLSDAQGEQELKPRAAYVRPQVLWWAFDRKSAAARGATAAELRKGVTAAQEPKTANETSEHSVVLIDEMDKADPDVPNDLLEVLDVQHFTVDELDIPIQVDGKASSPLVMITSNGERDMPPAFLRRCVVLALEEPTEDWLVTIASHRFGTDGAALHRPLARKVIEVLEVALSRDLRGPSTAEYLDAVQACVELKIKENSDSWQRMVEALLEKRDQPPSRSQSGPA